jgi:hypothetical protein
MSCWIAACPMGKSIGFGSTSRVRAHTADSSSYGASVKATLIIWCHEQPEVPTDWTIACSHVALATATRSATNPGNLSCCGSVRTKQLTDSAVHASSNGSRQTHQPHTARRKTWWNRRLLVFLPSLIKPARRFAGVYHDSSLPSVRRSGP